MKPNACLIFPNGDHFFGEGYGYEGTKTAELCFNTSMTGYQEILSDLSYAGQVIIFTFPHLGITGTNKFDNESIQPAAIGMVTRTVPNEPSSWRSEKTLQLWLKKNKIIGIGGIDTRKLTRSIRLSGSPNVVLHYSKKNQIDLERLVEMAKNAPKMTGTELARAVTTLKPYFWGQDRAQYASKFKTKKSLSTKLKTVVALDYGAKENILNCVSSLGCKIVILPATAKFSEIMECEPDGIILSNGPGDPSATFSYTGSEIKKLIYETKLPIFGICLGHQLLALALGGKIKKMNHGHHGSNHPVKDLQTGKVMITSMNHGFSVDRHSLPPNVCETHISLFDGTNCGISVIGRNIFSVQYHPEASPGPTDNFYLFELFNNSMQSMKKIKKDYI